MQSDHYYLLCPRALLVPSRWAEVNPLDERLSFDEKYNAGARLILLGTGSAAIITGQPLKAAAGGLLALALLHLHRSSNLPDDSGVAVESMNPLPLAPNVVRPVEDARAMAVDSAFGTSNPRGEIQLMNLRDKVMPDRRALHGLNGDSSVDHDDEPMNRSRLFTRQMGRRNFSVVSGTSGAPEI